MIESIKMGIRLLRYTWGIKTSICMAGVFLLIGFGTAFFPLGFSGQISSYMLLMVALWPAQMLWSLCTARVVQTSPWGRRMQTLVPAVINVLGFCAMYLLVLGVKAVQYSSGRATAEEITFELLQNALWLLLLMLYYGMAFKMFVLSTGMFLTGFMVITGITITLRSLGVLAAVPLWAAVLCGFAALFFGGVLQYGLLLLTYKLPPSKGAQFKGVQKYM